MSDASAADDSKHIEELYQYVESLNEAKDKSQNVKDYQGIIDTAKSSIKAKQLAAQFIPRFFKFFPTLSGPAIDTHLDLIEEEELGVRVQAIRGLPLFCKDTPEHIAKIVDILVQLLAAEEFVERDAVHKALMSLLTQDVKASLTALFKHIGSVDEPSTDEIIREKVLSFIRDKIFPIKAELLKPPEEMERHITDLIKKVSDADHIDRLISCLYMALPFVVRGASSSKFLNYLNKHIIPVFDKLPEERKLDLLKALAEISPYTTPQDSRQVLPNVVQLLIKEIHASEEDWRRDELYLWLSNVVELTRATMKKLTQGMAEHNKAMAAAKSDEAKNSIMSLFSGDPVFSSFIGDKSINLSWKEATKPSVPATAATTGGKWPATAANGSGNVPSKKGRGAGGLQNQMVNRALEDLSHGGRSGTRGRGRGWGGRGRGRGYR
ncbi:hypothetical protein FH972_000558 [Carpinus fangiana]|uniref:Apoptosis inhibitor 5 n=1 Tax=Carpinus fangiana TaxID=176857 RepID=A0A5N6QC40_9ROSI|nr:hypothetical protein FH972_000558 [Carpinus fangiana]